MASCMLKVYPSNIAIIGTGDFARALAKRLLASGVSVTIGSRHPERRLNDARDDVLTRVSLVSIQQCVQASDVIVVALHPGHYSTLTPLVPLLVGKILIDVSNSSSSSGRQSNAETLQEMFPLSFIVKSLNTVSAYSLESGSTTHRPISVCADDPEARRVVMQLINRIGLFGVDGGTLERARHLEQANRTLFAGWGLGTLVTVIVASVWIAYGAIRYFVIKDPPLPWYRMFSDVLSKVFACISITLLGLTYIPGPIAALTQLVNGTKHKRFPESLSNFLKMRKQLGLYALLFAVIHAAMSLAMLSPAYYGSWFEEETVVIPSNVTGNIEIPLGAEMSWKGEICVLLGILTVVSMSLLGVTSIQSVAESFNWREWRCVHSHFGFVLLLFAVAHVAVNAGPGWKNDPFSEVATKLSFLSLPLPMFALLLKIIILTPCVYIPVQRIRQGWERGGQTAPLIVLQSPSQDTAARSNGIPVNRNLSYKRCDYDPKFYDNRIMHTTEV